MFHKRQDETAVIERAKLGSAPAFNELVERYYGLIYSIGYARLRQREVAEELAQDVFVRAFLNLHSLNKPQYFAPWISAIARNLAHTWATSAQQHSRLLTLIPFDRTEHEMPNENAADARQNAARLEDEKAVRSALDELTADDRELIMLHFAEGLSKSEIARSRGVHPSSIGRQLETVFATLRRKLGKFYPERVKLAYPRPGAKARSIAAIGGVAAMTLAQKNALAAEAVLPALPASLAPATVSLSFAGSLAAKVAIAASVVIAVAGGIVAMRHSVEAPTTVGIQRTYSLTTTPRQTAGTRQAFTAAHREQRTTIATAMASDSRSHSDKPTTSSSPAKSQKPPPLEPGSGIISGVVSHFPSGEGVAGATVQLRRQFESTRGWNEPLLTATTDNLGSYRFEKLPTGKYLLYAEKGKLSLMPRENPSMNTFVVEYGRANFADVIDGEQTQFDLQVYEGHTITGTVRDSHTSAPVQGVRVYTRHGTETPQDLTGEDGTFELEAVFGWHEWTNTATLDASTTGFVLQYHEPAIAVHMSTDSLSITRDITMKRATIVSGKVVDPEGKPQDDAVCNLVLSSQTMSRPGCMTNESGQFQFTAQSGEWARISIKLDTETTYTEAFKVVDGETTLPPIVVGAGTPVEGRVTDDSGVAVPNAGVYLSWGLSFPDGSSSSPGDTIANLRTDADGRFRIASVAASPKYELHIQAEGYRAYKAHIAVPTTSPLTIVTPRKARNFIAGFVRSPEGNPVANAAVTATWITGGKADRSSVRSSATGWFKLEEVDSDRANVQASKEDIGYDILEDVPVNSSGITLMIGGVNGAAEIHETVVDALTSAPIENFQILSKQSNLNYTIDAGKGTFTGRYTSDFVPSTYRVVLTAPGYKMYRSENIDVKPENRKLRLICPLQPER